MKEKKAGSKYEGRREGGRGGNKDDNGKLMEK